MKIPTLEYIKSLPTDKEYHFTIFRLLGSSHLRISYNEDSNRKIALDYMEGGYLHPIFIKEKSKIIVNQFYRPTKENYNNMVKAIYEIRDKILQELRQE